MSRPIVGVTCHLGSGDPYYRVNRNYCEALEENGAIPIILPHSKERTLDDLLRRINGIMLTGGAGAVNKKVVNPAKDLPPLREQNPRRYDFEKMLIEKASSAGLPIIGICRGHQMIGEVFGGKICPNIKNCFTNPVEHYQTAAHSKPTHKIKIEGDSRLFGFVRMNEVDVNSLHRQCLITTPKDFIVGAKAPDGVIEEIEHRNKFILGLQFHPEHLFRRSRIWRNLLEAFVKECDDPSGKR